MLLNAKNIAICGIAMALAVIAIIMSGVLSVNTLALLFIAGFISGMVAVDMGIVVGAVFVAGTFFLGFFLAPVKSYCFTYLAFALYLLLTEGCYKFFEKKGKKDITVIMWVIKFVLFNACYIPVLIFLPEVLLGKQITGFMWIAAIVAGQIALVIFDIAYNTLFLKYWKPLRARIMR